jgi:flagellar motility protein MotE (MotC chaperone)
MRPRLLPLLMFALVATTTVKLGSVWNAFEVSVGTATMAQTQPTPPAEAPAAAEAAQPATPPAESAAAPVEDTAPAEGAAPAATEQAPAPIDLLQGAGGEGTASEAPVDIAAEPVVPDPFDYTDEEVDVLQQLAKRREALELRARQLDEREALIQAAEQRMDQKMGELKALQAMVEDLLKKRSDEQEAELKSLVKVYENMKPKDAAQVFEEMDMDVLLDVVERMNERKAAPILALVTPTRAKEITFELASRKELPLPQ